MSEQQTDMPLPQLPPPDQTREVSVNQVATWLEEIRAGKAILVDCREDEEWGFNRIEGATHIPMHSFPEREKELLTDKEKPVIVYCHHGMRSLRCASFLRAKGHPLAYSMEGGIELWSLKIDPDVPRY